MNRYVDVFTATRPNDPSFFANLSFVVHLSNKTRIGCANFTMLAPGGSYTPSPASTASSSSIPYPSESARYNTSVIPSASATTGAPIPPTSASPSAPAQFSGAASKIVGGSAALLAAAAAMVL